MISQRDFSVGGPTVLVVALVQAVALERFADAASSVELPTSDVGLRMAFTGVSIVFVLLSYVFGGMALVSRTRPLDLLGPFFLGILEFLAIDWMLLYPGRWFTVMSGGYVLGALLNTYNFRRGLGETPNNAAYHGANGKRGISLARVVAPMIGIAIVAGVGFFNPEPGLHRTVVEVSLVLLLLSAMYLTTKEWQVAISLLLEERDGGEQR